MWLSRLSWHLSSQDDNLFGFTSAFEAVDAVDSIGRGGARVVEVARGARAREGPEPAAIR